METGHVVYFASQEHPFLVEATPCLDLDCSCSIMTLALSELVPPGSPARDRLTFTLRVCLRTWVEQDPPPRSLEVESLVREFLARFPTERIHELGKEFERTRVTKERLQSFSLSGSRDELVTYSDLIDEQGGVRSFPPEPKPFARVVADKDAQSGERPLAIDSKRQVRRNDPCPCGSGLKFKRCCARRSTVAD